MNYVDSACKWLKGNFLISCHSLLEDLTLNLDKMIIVQYDKFYGILEVIHPGNYSLTTIASKRVMYNKSRNGLSTPSLKDLITLQATGATQVAQCNFEMLINADWSCGTDIITYIRVCTYARFPCRNTRITWNLTRFFLSTYQKTQQEESAHPVGAPAHHRFHCPGGQESFGILRYPQYQLLLVVHSSRTHTNANLQVYPIACSFRRTHARACTLTKQIIYIFFFQFFNSWVLIQYWIYWTFFDT